MNKWMRWKKINYNCRAQALLEFAIFGSIILFCLNTLLQYGMDTNYRQFMQMTAFRRALSLSVNRRSTGGNSQVSVTTIADSSIPSADDPFHLKQFSPYSTQVSAVYSNTLYRDIAPYAYNIQGTEHLPTVDISVNEDWLRASNWEKYLREDPQNYKVCTQALVNAHWCDQDELGELMYPGHLRNDPKRYARNLRGSYTTAGFVYEDLPCGEGDSAVGYPEPKKYRQIEILSGPGKWWQWKDVDCNSKDTAGRTILIEGARVDVDDDFIEESISDIVKQDREVDPTTGEVTREEKILGWVMFDPDAGDINFVYGKPNPEKQVREFYTVKDEAGRDVIVTQGLQPGYTYQSTISPYTNEKKGTYTQHNEDTKQITTALGVHQDTTATRKIRLNTPVKEWDPIDPCAAPWPRSTPCPPEKLQSKEITSERTLHQEEEFGESTPF